MVFCVLGFLVLSYGFEVYGCCGDYHRFFWKDSLNKPVADNQNRTMKTLKLLYLNKRTITRGKLAAKLGIQEYRQGGLWL